MPEISRFYGIVVYMYFNEHPPAHFHAKYGSYWASVDIGTLKVSEGFLPRRAERLVLEWAGAHRQELLDNWDSLRTDFSFRAIEPLE